MRKDSSKSRGGWDNPAYVTFVNPFCIIRPDHEEDFSVSLEDINNNTYNNGLLCRIIFSIPSPRLKVAHLLICADGAVAAPMVPELKSIEDVLDVFNDAMCCLLLGGQLCEAVDSRDVVTGNLHERWGIWPTNLGQSLNAHFHSTIRMKVASTMDTILLSKPKNVAVKDFRSSYRAGRSILDKLQSLSPTLLLRGFTEMRYGNSVDALSNLWIVVEQLTELLWKNRFLGDSRSHPSPEINTRRRSLEQDTRTWSTSVRQEILYQLGVLPSAAYSKIYPARKARNDLVHEGRRPIESVVTALFQGVLDMIEIASGTNPALLRKMEIARPSDFHRAGHYDLTDWNKATSQQDGAGNGASRRA